MKVFFRGVELVGCTRALREHYEPKTLTKVGERDLATRHDDKGRLVLYFEDAEEFEGAAYLAKLRSEDDGPVGNITITEQAHELDVDSDDAWIADHSPNNRIWSFDGVKMPR